MTPGFILNAADEVMINHINMNNLKSQRIQIPSIPQMRQATRKESDLKTKINEYTDKMIVIQEEEKHHDDIELQIDEHTRLPPPPTRMVSCDSDNLKPLPRSPEQNMMVPRYAHQPNKSSHSSMKALGLPPPRDRHFSIASDHGVNTISYQHQYEIAAQISSPSLTPISMKCQVPKSLVNKR